MIQWAAGFFDGEGHTRTKIENHPGSFVIEISQRNIDLLYEFQDLFGGTIRSFAQANLRQCFKWTLSNTTRCIPMIQSLWPYLHDEKREQIENALLLSGW